MEHAPVSGPTSLDPAEVGVILRRLAAVLAGVTDAGSVLRLAIEEACSRLDAHQGLLVLLRPDGIVDVIANHRYPSAVLERLVPLSIGDRLPIVESLRSGRPLYVTDAETRDAHFPELGEQGAAASASLPLVVEGKVVGALGLAFPSPRGFDDDDQALLLGVAASCAATIDRLRDRLASPPAVSGPADADPSSPEASPGALARLAGVSTLGVIAGEGDRIREANDAFLAMLGYRRAELEAGQLEWPRLTPDVWAPVDALIVEQLMASGTAQAVEKEYLHQRGHRVPVLVAVTLVQREPFRWTAIVVDLTELKRLESALRDAEAARATAAVARELEAAQRLAHIGSWQWHAATDTATWSREMFRIHGIDAVPTDGVVSAPWWRSLVHPDDREASAERRLRVLRDGEPFSAEHRVIRPDGATRRVDVTAEPIVDDDGTVVGLRGTTQDLTEQRAAQDALVQAREALFLTELQRRHDHRTVEALQRAVLPVDLPTRPGLEIGACYEPAGTNTEIGGDWYDCFELADGRLALAVGDVAGHGLGSAALMAQLRNGLRAYAVRDDAPAVVVSHLNQLLAHLHIDSFATLVYAVYDPADGALRWTHAGHPPGLRFSPAGTTWLEHPGVGGPVLGVWADAEFPEQAVELAPGEGLLLYTDGLIERRGLTLQAGFDGLAAAVRAGLDRSPQELCDGLVESLFADHAREDDVCQLVLRRVG